MHCNVSRARYCTYKVLYRKRKYCFSQPSYKSSLEFHGILGLLLLSSPMHPLPTRNPHSNEVINENKTTWAFWNIVQTRSSRTLTFITIRLRACYNNNTIVSSPVFSSRHYCSRYVIHTSHEVHVQPRTHHNTSALLPHDNQSLNDFHHPIL